jgi:hypothetical protein
MSGVSGKSPNAVAGFETVVQPAKSVPVQIQARSWSGTAIVSRVLVMVASGGALAALLWFSLYLAAARIYQVDECCNISAAYALAGGHPRPGLDLFQVLLSWVLPKTLSSVDLFVSGRQVMVIVFWVNWLFIALATGERVLSNRWWAALLGAATLAPLWDYGFEIRHDSLLLMGMLIAWCTVRFGPPKPIPYFVVGMIVCAMQFAATKALVYTVPLSLAILVFPPAGRLVPRWRLALSWLLGVVTLLVLLRLALGASGLWADYVSGAKAMVGSSAGAGRHRYWWPTLALGRFIEETPFVAALTFSALIAALIQLRQLRRRWRSMLTWDGILPEALLLAVALGALLINPTPFLYNLVNLVPFAFLLAFRYGCRLWDRMEMRPELLWMIGSMVIFTHFLPFGLATRRHLKWPNTRQERLMQVAEALTDPAKDPVFDAVGMTPTRPIVSLDAFLHTMLGGGAGYQSRIADMLAARPAAVIIPNYRTDWLSPRDKAFIRERYVSVTDDLWVLGGVLPRGGGTFEVIHAGRYRIAPLPCSDLAGTYPDGFKALLADAQDSGLNGTVDGRPLTTQPVELSVGAHQIISGSQEQPTVVWVGPTMERLPRMRQGDHTLLFANGY